MAEFIEREALKKQMASFVPFAIDASNQDYVDGLTDAYSLICQSPVADVVERKTGKNVATEYDDYDQFVCSECGIELQDWHRVERDEDDGDVTYHEYRFRFCPNCGANLNDGSENQNWDMANIHTDDCW